VFYYIVGIKIIEENFAYLTGGIKFALDLGQALGGTFIGQKGVSC